MNIRKASINDIDLILELILELAEYEKLTHQVEATADRLKEWIFEKEKAHALLAFKDGEAIGYCIYFYNFSTFVGKAGIYIEDVYVRPEARGNGCGKKFFQHVAAIAAEEGCGRMDWTCLDWNQSSIEFYESLGAVAQRGWTDFRLDEKSINKIAK